MASGKIKRLKCPYCEEEWEDFLYCCNGFDGDGSIALVDLLYETAHERFRDRGPIFYCRCCGNYYEANLEINFCGHKLKDNDLDLKKFKEFRKLLQESINKRLEKMR